MAHLEKTERTTLRRLPSRGSHDRAVIHGILDEGQVCHIAAVDHGTAAMIPTGYVRDGDRILIHGSKASRMMRLLASGIDASVCITIVDGFVLARSAFHHSMNYRSVIMFGKAEPLEGEVKRGAMTRFLEGLCPGRSSECREPSEKELDATTVVAFPIHEASAKIRTGPPIDDDEDYESGHWAGVVPIKMINIDPIPDPKLDPAIPIPQHVRDRVTRFSSLAMKPQCERCHAEIGPDDEVFICSWECTFCPGCAEGMGRVCPNCSGELLLRPRRIGSNSEI